MISSASQQIKKRISEEGNNLISLLSKENMKQLSIKKGWINQNDPEKGQLQQFLNEINPSKKHILTAINKEIVKVVQSSETKQILACVGMIIGYISSLPDIMIESKIRQYFNSLNIGQIQDIRDNIDGIQLKRIVSILSRNQTKINFYVKTHAGGLLRSTNKSTSKPVDPLELLTYKILEYSGYGTEAHFFYDDIKNFYIGTRDVAYKDDEKKKYSEFLTPDRKELRFLRKNKINQKGDQDFGPPSAEEQSIIDGLMTADIISRIFCLTDVLTQDGNIVFIKEKEKEKWKLKIIDFRNNQSVGYPDGSDLFKGLVSGNGQFVYIGMDKVISYYLGTSKLSERIKFAMNFDYDVLKTALRKAEEEMRNYMNLKENFELFQSSQSKVFEYCSAIQQTISQFAKAAIDYNSDFQS